MEKQDWLEEAKKEAGVTTHKKVVDRAYDGESKMKRAIGWLMRRGHPAYHQGAFEDPSIKGRLDYSELKHKGILSLEERADILLNGSRKAPSGLYDMVKKELESVKYLGEKGAFNTAERRYEVVEKITSKGDFGELREILSRDRSRAKEIRARFKGIYDIKEKALKLNYQYLPPYYLGLYGWETRNPVWGAIGCSNKILLDIITPDSPEERIARSERVISWGWKGKDGVVKFDRDSGYFLAYNGNRFILERSGYNTRYYFRTYKGLDLDVSKTTITIKYKEDYLIEKERRWVERDHCEKYSFENK